VPHTVALGYAKLSPGQGEGLHVNGLPAQRVELPFAL
jgi:hypothetical protein